MTALLDVRDLRTHFKTDDGIVKAVDGVDFQVESGQTVGIVGESGCGKSVTCLSIMGLNDARNTTSSGEVLFEDENLLEVSAVAAAQAARKRDRDDLPGSDDVAEPGALHRPAAHRDGGPPPRHLEEGSAQPRHRLAEGGRDPARRDRGSTTIRTSSPAACASA